MNTNKIEMKERVTLRSDQARMSCVVSIHEFSYSYRLKSLLIKLYIYIYLGVICGLYTINFFTTHAQCTGFT